MHIRLKKDINSFENLMVLVTSLLLISIFSIQFFYDNLNLIYHGYQYSQDIINDNLNTDSLQHYFLTQFLNEGGDFWNNLSSWNFGPAPSIFPDLILIYLFYSLFNSVFWSVYTIALLQILTTYWLIIGITKHIKKSDSNTSHLSIIITSTLFIIVFAISSSASLSSFFSDGKLIVYPLIYFTNYHYAPVVIGGLLMILFCLKLENNKSNKIVSYFLSSTIFVISFLINLSDLLFFSSVIVPIMITYFILGIITKDKVKKYIIPLLFLASGLSAHFTKDFLFINNFKRYIAFNLRLFEILDLVKNIFLNQIFLTILWLMFFGWVFYRLKKDFFPLLYKWKNKEIIVLSQQEFNKFFIILFSISSVLMGVIALNTVGRDLTPRYLIFIFFIPLFFTGALRFTLLNNKWIASGLVLLALSFSTYTMIPPKNSTLKFSYENSNYSCLDKAIINYNKKQPDSKKLKLGMVSYWVSGYSFYNKSNIKLLNYNSSQEKMNPYFWLRSKKMFKYNSFDFVILDLYGHMKKNEVLNLLGEPKKEVNCGNQTLMIYGRDKIKISN